MTHEFQVESTLKRKLAAVEAELKAVRQQNDNMRNAMREFCDRVDRGEVRSIYTYNLFKDLLK